MTEGQQGDGQRGEGAAEDLEDLLRDQQTYLMKPSVSFKNSLKTLTIQVKPVRGKAVTKCLVMASDKRVQTAWGQDSKR